MDNIIKEEILKALKDELEFDYDCGYRCVDGTDITVNIIDSKAKVDLSFIGEAPIFELLKTAQSPAPLLGYQVPSQTKAQTEENKQIYLSQVVYLWEVFFVY